MQKRPLFRPVLFVESANGKKDSIDLHELMCTEELWMFAYIRRNLNPEFSLFSDFTDL